MDRASRDPADRVGAKWLRSKICEVYSPTSETSVFPPIPSVGMPASSVNPQLKIVWPQDKDFEDSRIGRVFNYRRPSRYPLAIVHVRSEKDIVGAIQLSKELDCNISVRSGGHSFPVWSVRDRSILIDLGAVESILAVLHRRLIYN